MYLGRFGAAPKLDRLQQEICAEAAGGPPSISIKRPADLLAQPACRMLGSKVRQPDCTVQSCRLSRGGSYPNWLARMTSDVETGHGR